MSAIKRKVLILADWYYPGNKAGGPIQSCVNLVRALSHEFEFFVYTGDRDLGDDRAYSGVNTETWILGKYGESIYYIDSKKANFENFKKVLFSVDPDTIYLNSMFSVRFSIIPRLILKRVRYKGLIVLAPRGMLRSGALNIKPLKKKLFLHAFKYLGLFKRIRFHATDEQECQDVIQAFPKAEVFIASNIPNNFSGPNRELEKYPGNLNLVMVSRIHPIKNIHFILEVLKSINEAGKISLYIYGNAEDADYLARCEDLIMTMPDSVVVKYMGGIPNSQVSRVITENHAFVLPTLGENFGHAIFEALSSGRPVIISNQTPWVNLKSQEAGWDIPLNNADEFKSAILELLHMEQSRFNKLSWGASEIARKYISQSNFSQKYQELFQ